MSNTHTVVVDACRLQLRPLNIHLLNCTESKTINGTTLELYTPLKTDYRVNYKVYVNKQLLGTLGILHFKSVVDKYLYSFSFYNSVLYTDFVDNFGQFLTDFQLVESNITSLEIAIDTNADIQSDFLKYFNDPENYNYHYSPTTLEELKIVGNMYRDGSQNISLYPYISVDKKLKIYNKTLEIKDSGKSHVTDYHAANGLDIVKPVTRVELTLLNSAFKGAADFYVKNTSILTSYQYKELDDNDKQGYVLDRKKYDNTLHYKDLRNKDKLLELFNKYTNGFKAFSVKAGKTRKTRCKPVELLDFDGVGEPVPIICNVNQKEYKNNMTATYKTLIRQYYSTNKKQFLETAQLLAKETNTTDEYLKQLKALEPLKVLYQTTSTVKRNYLPF